MRTMEILRRARRERMVYIEEDASARVRALMEEVVHWDFSVGLWMAREMMMFRRPRKQEKRHGLWFGRG